LKKFMPDSKWCSLAACALTVLSLGCEVTASIPNPSALNAAQQVGEPLAGRWSASFNREWEFALGDRPASFA
jgi:hypothetical protein